MSTGLSDQQKEQFKEVFQSFDTDGSGSIDGDELQTVLRECGFYLSKEEVMEMIAEFDTDGNAELEVDEFLQLMEKVVHGPSRDDLADEMFKLFDADGDGKISKADLAALASKAGQRLMDADLTQIIAAANTSGDGSLSKDEFKTMCFELFEWK